MCHVSGVTCHLSRVTCNMSIFLLHKKFKQKRKEQLNLCVMCHVLRVTCHLSPATNANSCSHNPPPANSPTMQSSLVCKDPKNHSNLSQIKPSSTLPILAIHSLTRGLQSNGSVVFLRGRQTDMATYRLNRPIGQCSEDLDFFFNCTPNFWIYKVNIHTNYI